MVRHPTHMTQPSQASLLKFSTNILQAQFYWYSRQAMVMADQCVKISDSMQTLCKVLSGVLQGSVFGPLLYVIFINELPECIKSAIPFSFTADAKCLANCSYIRSTTDTDKLQEDINNATDQSHLINLLFNVAKVSIFTFCQNHYSIQTLQSTLIHNENPIKTTSQHKDLGIIITGNLNWTEDYKMITARAYQTQDVHLESTVQKQRNNSKLPQSIHKCFTFLNFGDCN